MQNHYEMLLESIVSEPHGRLNALNILTAAEKERKTTEQDQQEEASLKKLMNTRRKSFRRAQETEVTTDSVMPGEITSPQKQYGVEAAN